jgi:DGQHR domain-containing protein
MKWLRIPALRIQQTPNRVIYSFAVDGKLIPQFAAISRVRRDEKQHIAGYQRPEVLSHIDEICQYIESADPLIPNSVVIAFDASVKFEPSKTEAGQTGYSEAGMLSIPVDDALSEADKPGWIVDGQQRIAAIREARVAMFPISVTAFVASSLLEQSEQFILVNSTKPLPKGLIYELLPTTTGKLSSQLQKRRFPSYLLDRLNHDDHSPLKDMIRTPTASNGIIKDNSILKMLENSLSDGALYRFRDPMTGTGDAEAMLAVVRAFWSAAKAVFKNEWGLPPRRSRLMHGAGIVSLGFVMDAIADRHRGKSLPQVEDFVQDLKALQEICRWTDGYWDFGPGAQRKWDEIQNTAKDIQLLSNFLLIQYKARVWSKLES